MPRQIRSLAERLKARTDSSGGPSACWPWKGAKTAAGYGSIGLGRPLGQALTHRLAYAIANGPIPAGMHVLHACDNPACVNPAHLRVGTHADNMKDMRAKKRGNTSVLTPEQVRAIRDGGEPSDAAAARYGVSRTQINRIRAKTAWRWLP